MRILWQSETLQLLPEKAVFWEKENTLFLADPHFGKAAAFRKAGIPIPEITTEDDLQKLSIIVEKTGTERIIFLGDFIHARQSKTQVLRNLLFLWREEFAELELHLIRGNHDLSSGDPWPELGIECHDEPWSLSNWDCRHHPVATSSKPYFAGHVHPGYALRGKGRTRERSSCFQISKNRIIFPAFGSFTGLKNIKPEEGEQIFVTNGKQIIGLPSLETFILEK